MERGRAPTRVMTADCAGYTYYSSAFNPNNGVISRIVDLFDSGSTPEGVDRKDWDIAWERKYRHRDRACSPVPETVDIQVTNTCKMGCSYCYQNSVPALSHMPAEKVEHIIKGFSLPPYQIAFGGGEPCEHPDFASILRNTRALGVVPNFTTAGYIAPTDVLDATNDVCGGVAVTYHPHYNVESFAKVLAPWKELPNIYLHIHLVACKGVSERLRELATKFPFSNIVLLAYYPVGRGSIHDHMDKKEYMVDLPAAIKWAQEARHVSISFSEGLFPYFNSRPGLVSGVGMSLPAEGRFSCYVDRNGGMSYSSFSPPDEYASNVFEVGAQAAWDDLWDRHLYSPQGIACSLCPRAHACTSPHQLHKLLCAQWPHNKE